MRHGRPLAGPPALSVGEGRDFSSRSLGDALEVGDEVLVDGVVGGLECLQRALAGGEQDDACFGVEPRW
jgi:hypothetical protein